MQALSFSHHLKGGALTSFSLCSQTGDPQWYTALDGLLNRTFSTFFLEKHGGIMEDILCEAREICNNNEVLFKGLLSTWFSYIALIVPSTYDRIMPKLQTAAVAAAASCNGEGKNICGVRWYESKFDGNPGMEQQISVSQVLSANLLPFVQGQKSVAPVTSSTGGNSESNPDAGLTDPIEKKGPAPISTGDRAGAGILTVVLAVVWAAMMAYAVI